MAIDPSEFDDIFKRFGELSREDQQELLDELEHRRTADTQQQNDGRTLFDAFNERGMAGSIKDAPADWSTNPKYLEGLGQDDK
ncbi:MAG: hypothetical protein MI725_17900 [Pirellulales bacterium]|nr:hypothetical protein [Pirellulales bacterium]